MSLAASLSRVELGRLDRFAGRDLLVFFFFAVDFDDGRFLAVFRFVVDFLVFFVVFFGLAMAVHHLMPLPVMLA